MFLKEITAELPLSGKDEATSMAPQAARQVGEYNHALLLKGLLILRCKLECATRSLL